MSFYIKLTKNKGIEFQCGRWTGRNVNWFNFRFAWSRRCDHAGLELWAEILGVHVGIEVVDSRHWHYEKNDWSVYEDKGADGGTLGEKD